MLIIIFTLLGSLIGVTTHIDSLQFQEIDRLNEKNHVNDKAIAVLNERVVFLSELVRDLRTQIFATSPHS
jgi:hypothetical protein